MGMPIQRPGHGTAAAESRLLCRAQLLSGQPLSFEELGTPRTGMRSASVQHPTLKVTGRKAGVWECGRRRSCLVRWEVSGLYGGGSRRLEWDRMHKKVTDNPGKKL